MPGLLQVFLLTCFGSGHICRLMVSALHLTMEEELVIMLAVKIDDKGTDFFFVSLVTKAVESEGFMW